LKIGDGGLQYKLFKRSTTLNSLDFATSKKKYLIRFATNACFIPLDSRIQKCYYLCARKIQRLKYNAKQLGNSDDK